MQNFSHKAYPDYSQKHSWICRTLEIISVTQNCPTFWTSSVMQIILSELQCGIWCVSSFLLVILLSICLLLHKNVKYQFWESIGMISRQSQWFWSKSEIHNCFIRINLGHIHSFTCQINKCLLLLSSQVQLWCYWNN